MSAVRYEKRGHVAIVTIDRPKARNALSPEVIVRLDRAWSEARDDDEVRVAIVLENLCCVGIGSCENRAPSCEIQEELERQDGIAHLLKRDG